MRAASIAFVGSMAVTIQLISCIQTTCAWLRALLLFPEFTVLVRPLGNSAKITSWASNARFCCFRTQYMLALKALLGSWPWSHYWVADIFYNAAGTEANTGAGTGDQDDRRQGFCWVFWHYGNWGCEHYIQPWSAMIPPTAPQGGLKIEVVPRDFVHDSTAV